MTYVDPTSLGKGVKPPNQGLPEDMEAIKQEVQQARNGYDTLDGFLDSLKDQTSNMAIMTKTLTTTAGQGTIDVSDKGTIASTGHIVEFLVDGVPQYSSYTLTNETTLTMNGGFTFSGGEVLYLQWIQGNINILSSHAKGHEIGGYDPIEIDKLTGFTDYELDTIYLDVRERAVSAKYPPAPLVAAVSDANYYKTADKKWYQDAAFTTLATDNSSVFTALEALGVPIFCPPGNYYAPTVELSGWYFGKGAMIICKEKTSFNSTIPTSQQTGLRNYVLGSTPQPTLNDFFGKGSGNSLQADAYANTGGGDGTLTSLTTGKRNTAFGFQAMKSNTTQYSNVAIGADALSTGRYFTRTTAIGDNALKWGGILDPITSRHELWVNEYDVYNVWNDPTSDFYRLKTNNPTVETIIQPTGYSAPAGATIINPGGGFPAATSSDDVARNIALGRDSLLHLVKGSDNVALGYQAHAHGYTASENTAVGNYALADGLAGGQNTAVGKSALTVNQNGFNNTVVGAGALPVNVTGNRNTVVGSNAGALLTSDNNILIGYKARALNPTSSRNFSIDYGNDTSSPIPYMYGSMTVGSEYLGTRSKEFRLGGDAGANGGVKWVTGTGSPEGVVAAPVGSMYTRTDGGANTTLYVKESGTGNTGWIAK